MEKEIIIANVQYNDPEHEAALNEIKGRLISKVELHGLHDGAQNKPQTPAEHQAFILTLIEVTLQSGIDRNGQKYLPISGIAAAKLIESDTNKKERELQNAINEEEHTLSATRNEADKFKPDVKLITIRKLVFAGLVFISLSEGYLSYPAFRHAFQVIPSLFASIAIAIAVCVCSHFSGGFIKRSVNQRQMVIRYIISLVPAVIAFGMLSVLRARAYNHVTQLSVGQYVAPEYHNNVSALPIAIISILFYMVGLFLSAQFFKTPDERLREQAYIEKRNALAELQKSIQDKKDEIVRIRYDKVSRMTLAVKMFEYAVYQERHLVNFARVAAEAYKQTNRRHRTDGCPAFFAEKPIFNFNLFFNNIQTQHNEAA
jgi:hypothetical protein